MKITHERDKTRQLLLWLDPNEPYIGGCKRFSGLTRENIAMLVNQNLINWERSQSDSSPTGAEFYQFLLENDGYHVGGYVTSPDRDDCRITIDLIEGRAECPKAFKKAFFHRNPDEFTARPYSQWAWWD